MLESSPSMLLIIFELSYISPKLIFVLAFSWKFAICVKLSFVLTTNLLFIVIFFSPSGLAILHNTFVVNSWELELTRVLFIELSWPVKDAILKISLIIYRIRLENTLPMSFIIFEISFVIWTIFEDVNPLTLCIAWCKISNNYWPVSLY